MPPKNNIRQASVVERERQHHNERFSHEVDPRTHLDKWYRSLRHGVEKQNKLVIEHATGKRVLEYGCATGEISLHELELPELCESLTGIDISDIAIERAEREAAHLGYENVNFLTMNAEAMTFANERFDVVFGRGIIHHLSLDLCFHEISRVLNKNGSAIFYEPMGHNPFINMFRRLTPTMRTQDEHPLLMKDFNLMRRYFADVDITFYGFLSVASVLLDSSVNGFLYRITKNIDEYLLKLPIIRRYAWHVLIVCRNPLGGA